MRGCLAGLGDARLRSRLRRVLALVPVVGVTAVTLSACVVAPGYVAPAPVYVAPGPVVVAPAPVVVYGRWWGPRRR
jgi:hypothetical protein